MSLIGDLFKSVTGGAAAGSAGGPGGMLAGVGIQVGTGLLARLIGGRRKSLEGSLSDGVKNFSLADRLGAVQADQHRKVSASLAMGGRQAVEDLAAAGVTGSGMGASLAGLFRNAGDSMVSLSAQQSDEQARAMQADVERQTRLQSAIHQDKLQTQAATVEGIVGIGNSAFNMFRQDKLMKDLGMGTNGATGSAALDAAKEKLNTMQTLFNPQVTNALPTNVGINEMPLSSVSALAQAANR